MAIDRIDANPPLFGGGSSGNLDVNATTPFTILDGGTDASTVVGARHNLFNYGTGVNQVGDIYVRGSATALNRLAAGAATHVLTSNGPGTLPSWQASSGGPGGGGTVNAGTAGQIAQYPIGGGDSVGGVTVSGDATLAQGGALTLATVNSNVGAFQGITVNAKGLVTGAVDQGYVTGTNLTTALSAIDARIDGIENLGHYVGAFNTRAAVPTNTSGFPQGISVNDFATVRADETQGGATTRYVASGITGGVITWTYDVTYSTDISGKMDLVPAATTGHLATFNASGQVVDGGAVGNQTITLSGDIGGSGTTAITTTLPTINSNVGAFQGITINAKGQVTGAVNQNYLTGNQTVTLSGDVSGSGATAITAILPTVNSNVGTFQGLTVNAKGLVTAAVDQGYLTQSGADGRYLQQTGGAISGPITTTATTPGANDLVNKTYVDQKVASGALYQTTWNPALDDPNLELLWQTAPPPHGAYWIIDPGGTFVGNNLPGIPFGTVFATNDHIMWDATVLPAPGAFKKIPGGGLSISDADARYLQLTGGTLAGTLSVGTPTAPVGGMQVGDVNAKRILIDGVAPQAFDEPMETGVFLRQRRPGAPDPVFSWAWDLEHTGMRSLLRFSGSSDAPYLTMLGKAGKPALIGINDVPSGGSVCASVGGISSFMEHLAWNQIRGVGFWASAANDGVGVWVDNIGNRSGVVIETNGSGPDAAGLSVIRHQNTPGPSIRLTHHATGPGMPRISRSQQGNLLGDIVFAGVKGRGVEVGPNVRGGTFYANTAAILARATEDWLWDRPPEVGYNYGTDNAHGSCLEFQTTANGTNTPRTAFRIDHDGKLFVLSSGVLTDLSTLLGGSGGPVTWGSITGTLGNQTDLNNALSSVGIKSGGNIALGNGTLSSATASTLSNVAIGSNALYFNTDGSHNLAVGVGALFRNTTGNTNIAFGGSSLAHNTDGYSNIAVGNSALGLINSGSENIGIGSNAGRYVGSGTVDCTSATRSIYIGTGASASAVGQVNEIVIGSPGLGGGGVVVGRGSNTIVLGNPEIAALYTRAGLVIGAPAGDAQGPGTANIQGPIYLDGVEVEIGDPDSAGVGYRSLRVVN